MIAYQIPAWSYSVREQLQQAPKYFFFDNGVLGALLGDLQAELKPSTYRFGSLFENFIVTQIIQWGSKNQHPIKFYHYRTQIKSEIDLILQRNPDSRPVAVKIKSSSTPEPKDVPKIRHFQSHYPEGAAIVICRTDIAYRDEGIEFLPIQEGIEKAFQLALEEN